MSNNNNRGATIYQQASTSEKTIESPPDSSEHGNFFTVGKIDAGIAVLISDSVHLIEFPSLLLPGGVGPGSIVNISCTRNFKAEELQNHQFWNLQSDIFNLYGEKEPEAPILRVRNTTQTSVTLEWDKLVLAQAKLLGLSIWRNGQRLTTIPNPLHNTSTKLSGLALDSDYTFHLVLKTSAGTYNSPIIKVHTHTIADTSGISVCFGLIEPETLLIQAKESLIQMGAKSFDKIQIDTTHFVATSPASISNPNGGPGVEYQKAMQLSIPVVSPEWVIACQKEKKMVPIANYYSVGTINHSASISSATLVTPSGTIPTSSSSTSSSNYRRATAVTINENEVEDEEVEEEDRREPVSVREEEEKEREIEEVEEEEVEGPPEDQVVKEVSIKKEEVEPTRIAVEEESNDSSVPTIEVSEPEFGKVEDGEEEVVVKKSNEKAVDDDGMEEIGL